MTYELLGAALSGNESKIKELLLKRGSNALAEDNDGSTALMYAAYNGHTSCIQLLLPVSDALAKDKKGRTALTWAEHRGHTQTAQLIQAFLTSKAEKEELLGYLPSTNNNKKKGVRL